MLMSAFLLRFKANYLEKMRGYPCFSWWIPIALAKIYFFRMALTRRKKPLYLVGTVLKEMCCADVQELIMAMPSNKAPG